MKTVQARIDKEQDILEAYQSSSQNRREDIFAMALDFLPADALDQIAARFIKKEGVRS